MGQQKHYLGLGEIAQQIQSGETSSVAVTQLLFDRINTSCSALNAYISLMQNEALEHARQADIDIANGNIKSALHGVPIAVKDIFDSKGSITTAAMSLRENAQAANQDATAIARLKAAGTIILGKLNMTEGVYAEHLPPYNPPLNPWDEKLYPGASSSGSGVAIATGQCYAAISSDTGGSIRIPTATNGVTGLKPTWGRVSRHGVFELAATLDHVGVIARTAQDTGLILGAMAGADDRDPTASQNPVPDYTAGLGTDLSGLRIGIDRNWISKDVDSEIVSALLNALDTMQALGAQIIDIEFPDPTQIVEDWFGVCAVQTAFAHRDTYPSQKDQYGPGLSALIDMGLSMSGTDYQQMILRREEFTGRVQKLFSDIDLIACPALAFKPPSLERMAVVDEEIVSGVHRFTCSFTMARNPTITMCGGFSEDGLPLAIQFVAPHFEEHRLIKAGYAFQRSTDWHLKHPADYG